VVLGLAFAAVLGLGWAMAAGLLRDGFQPADAAMLALYLLNVAWIGFAAATALTGLLFGAPAAVGRVPADWRPEGRTAVLIPARNEDVAGLATRIAALRSDLAASPLAGRIAIFVLSDSDDPRQLASEAHMMASFGAAPQTEVPVHYRRRTDNVGRKPGNIGEWLRRWGGAYDYMLTLDADSRMSADRVTGLVHTMETRPDAGLVQAGVRLAGAETRFGRLQQLATHLYGPAFAAGIAGWAGNEGNYWGHNALIRVRAFAEAAGLPKLSGRPPFGGDVLSHDFVEAAWLRRAGWAVVFEPEACGSAEGGPQTLAAFHRRDRRWCQGNLQHLRILTAARGVHPVSRLHLFCGVGSYVAAPFWLCLVVAATLSDSTGAVLMPIIGAIGLILVPKVTGVLLWTRRRPRSALRILRLAAGEIAITTLLAPILMVRQTVAVVSVLAGQDCGWKPPAAAGRRLGSDDMPWLEPAIGAALLLVLLPGLADLRQFLFMLPIVLPLLAAPLIVGWLDLPRARPPRDALPPGLAPAGRSPAAGV
jgi:membrane glycosyltransferase